MNKSAVRVLYLKFIVVFGAVAIALVALLVYPPDFGKIKASVTGPSPSFTGAPDEANCTACHSSFPPNSGSGNVIITGVPANYRPGQQIPLTVTVNQSDAVIYGFQMVAVDAARERNIGTFTFPAASPQPLQIVTGFVNASERRYIEHTVNGVTPTQFGTKSWTFTWTAPATRVGKIGFYAAGNAADSDGSTSGDRIYTTSRSTLSGTAISSFDGDGTSEVAVFRPSNGIWFSMNSTDGGVQGQAFGTSGDKIAPGDYDGDGRTDRAVFRPSNGTWFLLQSTAGFSAVQFGASGDLPVTGDYDGDLKSDIAVYRPSTGVWYILPSTGGFIATAFGTAGDRTAQGDYDGDGKTDIAVFRPSNGLWYLNRSTAGFTAISFGLSGDQPVQGDYDGDGRHDVGVFRPSNGTWYISGSTRGFFATPFGISTDKAAPADFDGDGKTDITVFRPSNGVWYIAKSSDASFLIIPFGTNGDIPVPSGYIAE